MVQPAAAGATLLPPTKHESMGIADAPVLCPSSVSAYPGKLAESRVMGPHAPPIGVVPAAQVMVSWLTRVEVGVACTIPELR